MISEFTPRCRDKSEDREPAQSVIDQKVSTNDLNIRQRVFQPEIRSPSGQGIGGVRFAAKLG